MPRDSVALIALKEAVQRAGGQAALGRVLGITQAAVWKMLNKAGRARDIYAVRIEWATGVPRERLRPDLFRPDHGIAAGRIVPGEIETATEELQPRSLAPFLSSPFKLTLSCGAARPAKVTCPCCGARYRASSGGEDVALAREGPPPAANENQPAGWLT